jgi:hypothetical protein
VHFHLSPRDLDMVTENGDPIIARVTTPSVSEEDSRTPVSGQFHIDGHHALLE